MSPVVYALGDVGNYNSIILTVNTLFTIFRVVCLLLIHKKPEGLSLC